ncbi:MAG: ATP-binding protein [Candidatus Riflebacteria bacterium]|nr:ATP-binding protein [Candidatus Riflebacteria bacterium]
MNFYVSLRFKVILLLFVLLGGLSLTSNETSIKLIREKMREMFQQKVLAAKDSVKTYWESEKNALLNLAMLYSENERIVLLCAEGLEHLLQQELAHLTARTKVYDISVVLARGLRVDSFSKNIQESAVLSRDDTNNYLSRVNLVYEGEGLYLTVSVPVIKYGELLGRLFLRQKLNDAYVSKMAGYLQADISLAVKENIVASSMKSEIREELAQYHYVSQNTKDTIWSLLLGKVAYSVGREVLETTAEGDSIYIYTAVSEEKMQSLITEANAGHFNVSFWTFIAALIIAVIFTERVLLLRIKNLQKSAGIIADGDLDSRIGSFHNDELGSLADSFDKMADSLKEHHEKVKEYIANIENMAIQRKMIEMQLYHADKLSSVGKLAAGIAHEIKNPLASIKTLGQLIKEELSEGDSRREYAEVIVSEVDRLNSVVVQLLKYARPEESSFKDTVLGEIMTPVLALVSHEAERNKVELKRSYDEKICLFADAEKLKQVMINLIINAVQAMPESGGTIELEAYVSNEKGGIIINVKDNAKGMSPEALEKIFEPFFTTRQRGTGLGLAIVKKIIDLHGGIVEVQSEIGVGTCISLFLPDKKKE